MLVRNPHAGPLTVSHIHAHYLTVGHWTVLAHDPEALVISHVLDLLAEAVAVNVHVVALDSGLGVSNFVLLRVAVGVAVSVVAKVVLLIVLINALIHLVVGHLLVVAHGHLRAHHVGHLMVSHVHA